MITDAKRPVLSWAWRQYVRFKVRSAFRALWTQGQLPPGPEPLVVYANHTNFWDGFVAHELMARAVRDAYALMEEKNLRRYRFLTRLGAFSVQRGSAASARESIRHAVNVLRRPGATLLLFPQGRIRPFEAPLVFERGVELISKLAGVRCVPLALRYAVFEHEFPDVLVALGEPHEAVDSSVMTDRLTALRDSLAACQSPDGFLPLVRGRDSVAQRWDAARGLA